MTNLVNDEYRKREHVHIVSIDEPVLINGNLEQNVTQVFKDPGPSPDEQIEQTELLKDIWDGIVQLREPFKAALVLRDVDDLSYDEVAQVMGIRLGTVKSRIARARKQLSEILGERVRDAA